MYLRARKEIECVGSGDGPGLKGQEGRTQGTDCCLPGGQLLPPRLPTEDEEHLRGNGFEWVWTGKN